MGGAIYNARGSTLMLTDCTLTGNGSENRGGAIYNEGSSLLAGCTLRDNVAGIYGGGISSQTELTMSDCSLIGNSVVGVGDYPGQFGLGGAINADGRTMLTHCTLGGNSAPLGGAIGMHGDLTLINSTISGNSASFAAGGVYIEPGFSTARLTNCTVSENAGGGIGNDGSVSAINTILAAGDAPGPICSGRPLMSLGHNIDEDDSCALTDASDRSGVPANLTHLGNYGGPIQTIALCTGEGIPESSCAAASPAIDAGDDATCPAADQRGAPRPFGAACDIGAYESGANVPLPSHCGGDCDASRTVVVAEILTLVNIVLGIRPVDDCATGVPVSAAGTDVTVALIVQAVRNALSGCPTS